LYVSYTSDAESVELHDRYYVLSWVMNCFSENVLADADKF